MDSNGNQVPNFAVAINLHNNKEKVKNNSYERVKYNIWKQWLKEPDIQIDRELSKVLDLIKANQVNPNRFSAFDDLSKN